jgi:A/G-specific adenine glycosylase
VVDLASRLSLLREKQGLAPEAVRLFRDAIYDYYSKHGRKLPWRETRDPYRILVSEMMLQQTQVERVLNKYGQFIAMFPDFSALAGASLKEVLEIWQGLGYNRRALALKGCASIVVNDFGGMLPSDRDTLLTFPGIGNATASAVCAFAFDQPTILIETNIRRVFIHFFFREKEFVKDAEIIPLVKETLDDSHPRKWYYALMDYGAMLGANGENPNRRSAHYKRQSPFQGSNRQLRGMILKTLTAGRALSRRQLAQVLEKTPEAIDAVLIELASEGFIEKRGDMYTLR